MSEFAPVVLPPLSHIFWRPGEEREFQKQEGELDPKSLVCEDCWLNLFDTDLFEQVLYTSIGAHSPQREEVEKVYTTTWGAVRSSASCGCNFCRLAVLNCRQSDGSVDIGIIRYMDENNGHIGRFYVTCGKQVPTEDRLLGDLEDSSAHYSLMTASSGRLADIIRSRPVQNRVSGSQAIARAQDWVACMPKAS